MWALLHTGHGKRNAVQRPRNLNLEDFQWIYIIRLSVNSPNTAKPSVISGLGDNQFRVMFEEYHQLDDAICRIEEEVEFATDQESIDREEAILGVPEDRVIHSNFGRGVILSV